MRAFYTAENGVDLVRETLAMMELLKDVSVTIDSYESYNGFVPLSVLPFQFGISGITVRLDADGCATGNGDYNCTAACMYSDLAFQDSATMRNCMVYPMVREFLYNLDNNTYFWDNLDGTSRRNLKDYGFLWDHDPSIMFNTTIVLCFEEAGMIDSACSRLYPLPGASEFVSHALLDKISSVI